MSPASFAVTKIRPPRPRAQLVPRPALERKLAAAFAERKLTVLSAPAGFGKTAALTRQVQLLPPGTALAWVGADPDDDLHRLLGCLIAALEPFDLPWRLDPDGLVAAAVNARSERRSVASELLNALAAAEVTRGLIVIDDAHRITDAAVFEFLELLLERLPERWGMVIGTRVDPPLSLARLRAQGELVEVRLADLRFCAEETAALVALVHADGSPDATQVQRLLARTQGWAAGLRLMLNTGCGSAEPAEGVARVTDRHLFEYLACEVLDGLTPELRTFLMRCSVLSELTPSRCAAVSGNPRAARLLEEIEQRDLFVSVLEGRELTLALHELFRECLYERLRRDHPQELPELLRRAAANEPDPIRRMSLLLDAEAWTEAEATLDEVAAELLAGGIVATVPRLIERFPEAHRRHSPALALVCALTAWARWDWPEMLAAAASAVEGFERCGDERRRQRALVLHAIAYTGSGWTSGSAARLAELPAELLDSETRALAQALRVWHALDSGEFGAVAGHFDRLVDLLERIESLQVWYYGLRPLYLRLPGMQRPLERYVAGVMSRLGDAPSRLRALAHVAAAWLALWRGEVPRAMELAAAAEAEARWFGMPRQLRTFIDTFLAAAHAIRGDRDAALRAVDALLRGFDSAVPVPAAAMRTSMYGHYVFYAVRIADAVGDAQAVRTFAARMPRAEHITNAPMLRRPMLTLPARLAALDGDHALACDHWAAALADDAAIDIIGQAHESRLRYAWSLLALGRRGEAAATLRPVLRQVATDGEIGGALLAGRAVVAGLAGAAWQGHLTSDELSQLRDWMARTQSPETQAPQAACRDGERLTARELEILARIAAGDSNKLIARAFDLSPHTVKRHVANILEKLGLSSRSQAALWYRRRA